jgi:hypothetical protein
VLEARSGAGSIPDSLRISHTVDAAIFTPRTSNSPWILRYPQPALSFARRRTRAQMERTVRGRPGRFGRDAVAWRRASRSRCQRRTVSGRTCNRSLRSRCLEGGRAVQPEIPGQPARTAPSCHRVAAAALRSGVAGPGSRVLSLDHPLIAGGAWRTCSLRRGKPVAVARPIILPW